MCVSSVPSQLCLFCCCFVLLLRPFVEQLIYRSLLCLRSALPTQTHTRAWHWRSPCIVWRRHQRHDACVAYPTCPLYVFILYIMMMVAAAAATGTIANGQFNQVWPRSEMINAPASDCGCNSFFIFNSQPFFFDVRWNDSFIHSAGDMPLLIS